MRRYESRAERTARLLYEAAEKGNFSAALIKHLLYMSEVKRLRKNDLTVNVSDEESTGLQPVDISWDFDYSNIPENVKDYINRKVDTCPSDISFGMYLYAKSKRFYTPKLTGRKY